jgi:predicted enzyme related to lactoylglutathione lyase
MTNAAEIPRYAHGTIAWTELFAGDVGLQRDFYSRLLGWTFDEHHRARAPASGKLVAALRERRDAARGWVPFVAVEDVDAVRRAVVAASGTVHPGGEFEDPLGGRFAAWDGGHLGGAHGLNETGGLAWNEAWSPDVPATIAFYRRVVGWNLKEQPGFGGAPYTMFAGRDRPGWTHAGIRAIDRAGAPAHWMSYFEVASCEQSVETARGLGAGITLAATRVAGVGWIATAVDLEGSAFGFMQSGA